MGEIFGVTYFECYVSAFYLRIHMINLRIYLKNPLWILFKSGNPPDSTGNRKDILGYASKILILK